MIARITRALLLFQFLIATGIYFVVTKISLFDNAIIAVFFSMAMIIAVRAIITFNNFVIASRFRSPLPSHYRIGKWQMLRLFLNEFRATMLSSSWTMPFQMFSLRKTSGATDLPVLLIHGYGCNSGYWHAMSKALLDARIAHYAIDMEPVVGSIDDYVPQIHHAIEHLRHETGHDRIVIVAHSMGGLATRAYLRRHGSDRVARVITLGTPHHGTVLAHFGVGVNTEQMRWTVFEQEGLASDWLRELAQSESESVYKLFVSIYSHHDNIISPQTSSILKGAKNIEFHAIGHVALALDPVIQAQVIREIRDASAQVNPAASTTTQPS